MNKQQLHSSTWILQAYYGGKEEKCVLLNGIKSADDVPCVVEKNVYVDLSVLLDGVFYRLC